MSGPKYLMTSVSITKKLKKVILLNCYAQRAKVDRREKQGHKDWVSVLEAADQLVDVEK